MGNRCTYVMEPLIIAWVVQVEWQIFLIYVATTNNFLGNAADFSSDCGDQFLNNNRFRHDAVSGVGE